jgi:hypothetical protein
MAIISTMFFLLTFSSWNGCFVPRGYWMSRFVTMGVGTLAANFYLGTLAVHAQFV